MGKQDELHTECLDAGVTDGRAFIETASPLTRLHYFDGRFLRADDLAQEQAYHRLRVHLANQAGGWGVVHGLDVEVEGDQLTVLPGLGVTPAGEFVMAVGEVSARLSELLAVAKPAPTTGSGAAGFAPCTEPTTAPVTTTVGDGLVVYELTAGPIDALCGNEPVHGKLCELACVSDARHSQVRDGLVLRLRPIALPLPQSPLYGTAHLRNRVASAYFARERSAVPHLLNPQGLRGPVWCGPASIGTANELVLGVLVREGQTLKSLDIWTGRRERMETQARAYWQGRMAMRPWNAFLAQILQFQCQLSAGLGADIDLGAPADPCDALRDALDRTRREIRTLHKQYADSAKQMVERLGGRVTKTDATWMVNETQSSVAHLQALDAALAKLDVGVGKQHPSRWLLAKGFGELPPAGYLPVAASQPVAEQLARWFGEGVRLHLRAAPFDALPHLLEEAQHMNRISLTKGIDNPQALEDVEVFVPDGAVGSAVQQAQGTWWQTRLHTPLASSLVLMSTLSAGDEEGDADTQYKMEVSSTDDPQEVLLMRRKLQPSADADDSLRQLWTMKDQGTVPAPDTEGLTRTDHDDQAGHRLTVVLGGRASDALDEATQLPDEQQVAEASTLELGAAAGMKRMVQSTPYQAAGATYVAADLRDDPFTLAVGGSTAVQMELALLMSRATRETAMHLQASGRLTVLHRAAQTQRTVLRVQVDLDQQLTARSAGMAKTQRSTVRRTYTLSRKGDGREGVVRIDDARQDPGMPPIDVTWDDLPRQATVSMDWGSLVEQARDEAMVKAIQAAMAKLDTTPEDGRLTLLSLQALSGMPRAASPLAARALNALTQLAEVLDDAAFFHRARQRLLPAPAAQPGLAVRAVHDWVMFRRARPHFCDPVCSAPMPDSVVEAFQVWHLRLRSSAELDLLKQALQRGDQTVWAKLAPRRVGVLRYLDDNTAPEESDADVRAMWQAARPGSRLMLARVWERQPETGQGWQNHARVREMLRQLPATVQLPAQTSGLVGTLSRPPAALTDAAMDGGMLVVTMQEAAVETVSHRVVMLPYAAYQRMLALLRKQPDQGWAELADYLKKAKEAAGAVTHVVERVPDHIVQFTGGSLRGSDQTLLTQEAAYMTRQPNDLGYLFLAVRVDGRPPLANGVQPAAQHELLKTVLKVPDGAPPSGGDDGYIASNVSDFGGGAQVLTLVGVLRMELN